MISSPVLYSNSVVLVSGGARGVTAQCVIELAAQYRCRFVLLGRSSIAEPEPIWAQGCDDQSQLKRQIMQAMLAQRQRPKPLIVEQQYRSIKTGREIRATLRTVREAGGEADYISVDITDRGALGQRVAEAIARFGRITGIIHGAGTLADKRIEHKTDADFEQVYGTKVSGLDNLLSCVSPSQLDFLVLFSSFVGFYGNAGQSDYAVANEILNKSAHRLQQSYPRCRVVAMGWGPWDGGMVTAELKKHFLQLNMPLIPSEVGAKLLAAELATARRQDHPPAPQVTVMSQPIRLAEGLSYGPGYRHRVRRQLDLSANPFVLDHVIGHQPVLPAMCGLSWIANVGEQRYPGYRFFEAREFKVLKGIVFDQTLVSSYILDLEEISSDDNTVTLEAVAWSEGAGGLPRYHYRTQIVLLREARVPLPLRKMRSPFSTEVSRLYQDGTLFHRTGFQSIKTSVQEGKHLRCQCYLSALKKSWQGQFGLQYFNPYTADTLFQSLVVWVRRENRMGSLPAQFTTLRQVKSLPFDQPFEIILEIVASQGNTTTANAVARTVEGETCLEMEGMQVVQSPRLKQLFLQNVYGASAMATAS